jgi:hypothetical protein
MPEQKLLPFEQSPKKSQEQAELKINQETINRVIDGFQNERRLLSEYLSQVLDKKQFFALGDKIKIDSADRDEWQISEIMIEAILRHIDLKIKSIAQQNIKKTVMEMLSERRAEIYHKLSNRFGEAHAEYKRNISEEKPKKGKLYFDERMRAAQMEDPNEKD